MTYDSDTDAVARRLLKHFAEPRMMDPLIPGELRWLEREHYVCRVIDANGKAYVLTEHGRKVKYAHD